MDNGIEITCGKIQSWQVGACKHDVCDGVCMQGAGCWSGAILVYQFLEIEVSRILYILV